MFRRRSCGAATHRHRVCTGRVRRVGRRRHERNRRIGRKRHVERCRFHRGRVGHDEFGRRGYQLGELGYHQPNWNRRHVGLDEFGRRGYQFGYHQPNWNRRHVWLGIDIGRVQ